MPDNVKSQVVKEVDIKRFMGDWFVIATIPTPFEKGVYNGVETYHWNDKEQRIDVTYSFRKDGFNGERDEITQKGWIQDPVGKAHWKVQPFWPLKFDYLVIDLADDYSWTTVGVPDKSYVWIMARKHTMTADQYRLAVDRIRALGYDLEKLQKVPQNGQKP